MEITTWEYQGKFLEQFAQNYRGPIVNDFLRPIRAGVTDLDGVVEWVGREALQYLRDEASGNVYEPRPLKESSYQLLLDMLETDESYDFIEFLIARESLPEQRKQELKTAHENKNRTSYYQANPPSAKQLQYLRDLGCPEDQLPARMADASAAIDTWKKKNKEARSVARKPVAAPVFEERGSYEYGF